MATLQNAIASKVIEVFGLPDWEKRPPIRPLYLTPRLFDWIDGTSALWDLKLAQGGRLIGEHLEQSFCDFRCSNHPPAGDLRRMNPNSAGIRKLHSPGLRIYGWAPGPHSFVCVTAALETDTKSDKQLNNKKMQNVLHFIKTHRLEGTILRGDIRAVFPIQA